MKVAIAGAGIAGGYLVKLLGQKGVFPDVFDGMDHDTRCGCRSCGWGAPRGIGPFGQAGRGSWPGASVGETR
jgi:flavin-dependent dehydrogenase